MSKAGKAIARKLRGPAADEPLPELDTLSPRQLRSTLAAREQRLVDLAERGKQERGAARSSVLDEIRTTAAEVTQLRTAVEETPEVGGIQKLREARFERPPQLEQRKPTRAEQAIAVIVRRWMLPNELAGMTLHPENLDEAEGEELFALLKLEHGREAAGMSPGQTKRFQELVEKAAGWACFAELEAEQEIQRIVEQVRLAALPKRIEYAEIGSVHLPALVFSWLKTSRDRRWTVSDLGALAALLHCFEIRDAAIVQGARFEEIDGEPVLVGKGRGLRFVSTIQGDPLAGGSRVDIDLEHLAANRWLDVHHAGSGRVEVRLGSRGKKLRRRRSS